MTDSRKVGYREKTRLLAKPSLHSHNTVQKQDLYRLSWQSCN